MSAVIRRIASVEARCLPHDWTWAQENGEAIAQNWQKQIAAKPRMFNGRVLLIRNLDLGDETCRATFFETSYAEFMGWMRLGYPDPEVCNGFAMGALQGSDGAYVCGVMAGHTANAGRVYFPAGTPDLSDLRPDGTVDLASSVVRELHEETGLESGYHVAEDWIVVRHGPAVAFLRPILFPDPAEAVAERIRANIAHQQDPELAGLRVIRGPADVDAATMPLFLQSFFRWAFQDQPG